MTDTRQNWVVARANCTLQDSFDELLKAVNEDVDRFNRLNSDKRQARLFCVEHCPSGGFGVYRAAYAKGQHLMKTDVDDFVHIKCTPCGITACRTNGDPISVIPSWNEEAMTCDLRVNDEVLSSWRISQRILGDFLFGV